MQPFAHEPALAERVKDAIVEAIIEGVYRPGERLAQEDLAQRLGVSRQPVSHALNVLKEQGILIEFGRKGLTVAPVRSDHLVQLYQVRGRLDALAAGLAAQNVRDGVAVPTELAGLERLIVAQTEAVSGNFQGKVDADVAFHVGIYRLSGNPTIEEMARPQWVHFRRTMQVVLAEPSAHSPVWRQHQEIYQAILAGDADLAERLAFNHAESAAAKTAARLRLEEISKESKP